LWKNARKEFLERYNLKRMTSIRKNRVLFFSVIIGLALVLPFVGLAQSGFVTCDGPDCDFYDLLAGMNKIINWFILVGGSVAALGFAYVGFIYITQGGNPSKRAEANKIFTTIATGFFFLLGSWLIVKLIILGFGVGKGGHAIKFLDL